MYFFYILILHSCFFYHKVKISAVLTLAALWEIADNALPEQDYTISGLEICENPAKIAQAVSLVKQAAKESSKRISKRDKKEQVSTHLCINTLVFYTFKHIFFTLKQFLYKCFKHLFLYIAGCV